jgi:hypothetical protein
MKVAKPTTTTPAGGIFFAVLLAVILAVLFGKSFLPGYVHFSNDGPLGQQNAGWTRLPASFTGSWADLNDIGSSVGSWPLGLTALFKWGLSPVAFAKFFPPIALFILGLGAWTFFRQLRLSPLAATLGALAAVLNSTFFASACWGVAPQQIAVGMVFFALALVMSNSPATPAPVRWTRLALAGLAVGNNVVEAADIGAIFSLFVAIFVLFKAVVDESGPVWLKLGRGVGRLAVIAVFAGFIATQTVVSLVGSQIAGVAGTAQDAETKAQHWDWATQWSLPKKETLGLFMPGLFGYKLDTPNNMPDFLRDAYKGGAYWGGMGRDPVLDRFFDSGGQGTPPPYGFMRQTGGQNYVGILVALMAAWTLAQSLRRRDSVFQEIQRRFIWFWGGLLIVSLLMAYGRFAPFYALLYKLPYFSTIRNPTKFLIIFSWASVILFAYGVHALSRRFLEVPAANANSPLAQCKNWWMKVRGFDRTWASLCIASVIASFLAWLIYASEKPSLVRYLQTVGFGDEGMAGEIAAFSLGQAGWFILFLGLAAGLLVLIIAGVFAGKRAKLGGLLLGLLLVIDLGRADLPYIVHWDYQQKYDVDSANPASSTNPIINFLRDKPYEHRVTGLRAPPQLPLLEELYRYEWMQHQFPYFDIQSLDLVQRPRVPANEEAYELALTPRSADTSCLMARRWQLTNTRYLLGPAGFLDALNEQLDPSQHRFRIIQRFAITLKAGVAEFHRQLEELTAVPADNGDYALLEFTGALPRAKLYSNWQISTNDSATLETLTSTNFDPLQRVLVSTPLPVAPAVNANNDNSGTVEFKSYAPKDIRFDAKADAPSVLLLNDKFDPQWRVFVDGKPAELLRCNFIMRGVYLPPGPHTVEFQFNLPSGPLYVTVAAFGVGILLCGFLVLKNINGNNV